jgi:predicted component of type VI protein secretion system
MAMSGFGGSGHLVVKNGPRAGDRVEVASEITIGRRDVDLALPDDLVSRRHAVVRPQGDVLEVEDLQSRNGTWVAGRRIDGPVRLAHATQLRVGVTEIEVELPVAEPDATRVAARPPEARDATRVRADGGATAVGVRPATAARAGAEAPVAAAAPRPVAERSAEAAASAPPPDPFTAGAAGARRRAAATRSLSAALVVTLVIVATAVALVIYFSQR